MAINLGGWGSGDDGATLGGLSKSGDVLGKLGIDPDEAAKDPVLRDSIAQRLRSPYRQLSVDSGQSSDKPAAPILLAQNAPPPKPGVNSWEDPEHRQDDVPEPVLKHRAAPQPVQPAAAQQAPPDSLAGAAPTPQVSEPSAPAATPPAKPAAWQQDIAHQAATGILSAAEQARANYAGEAAPPDTSVYDSRIAIESIPGGDASTGQVTPLRDQSGKIQKEYKPSVMQRIGRGFKAAALGAVTGKGAILGAIDPEAVGASGYGAPNDRWKEDEEERGQHLSLDQRRKADVLARAQARLDASRKQAEELEGVAKTFTPAGTIAVDAQKAQTEETKESPEGKAAISEAEFKQLGSQADRLGYTGGEKAFYIGNKGKMPEPHQATAEEIARGQAFKAWERGNPGKQPTLDDVREINAAAAGRAGEGGSGDDAPAGVKADYDAGLSKITEFTSGYDRQADGSYRRKGAPKYGTPKEGDLLQGDQFDAKRNELRAAANKGLSKRGWQIDEHGQLAPVAKASGAPGGVGAPSSSDRPAGMTHKVKASDGKMHWGNPVTHEIGGLAE